MVMLKKVIVLFLIASLPVFAALKPGTQAPDFTLQDADDRSYTLSEMSDKIIILIFGTRDARKEGDKWMLAIDEDYGQFKEVNCYLIADLRGLPFFVTEGMVKFGVKREKIPFTTLLDWEGKIAQKYDTKKGLPNLFVIRQGKIVYGYSGKFSDESYGKLRNDLNLVLVANRSEQYQKLFRLCKKILLNIIAQKSTVN